MKGKIGKEEPDSVRMQSTERRRDKVDDVKIEDNEKEQRMGRRTEKREEGGQGEERGVQSEINIRRKISKGKRKRVR